MRPSNLLADAASPAPTLIAGAPFALGLAGYTVHDFTVDETLFWMKRWGLTQWAIKDVHLAQDSSADACAALQAKCAAAGVKIYAAGVIYMKTEAEVDRAFAYGQRLGVDLLTCAPNPELVPYVARAVERTGIRVAIHNHGPDNPVFPVVETVIEVIDKLDSRVGICVDVGHTLRAGHDPVAAVKLAAKRLFDVHFKDVSEAAAKGHTVPLGAGVLDIRGVIAALRAMDYRGLCALEYERDKIEVIAGMSENAGYWRGTRGCSI